MARVWWKYWQIVVSFWSWCFEQSMFFWNKRKDPEQEISTEMIDQALVSDVTEISRSSSMSTGSTYAPNVCVTDYDDEAEPYWQIMGELSDGCSNEDGCMGGSDLEGEGKQVLVGICAMAKKSQSKPMKEILTRLEEFEYIKILVFPEEVILKEPVEDWPIVDCLISFHSKGFPLDKAIHYANLRNPFIINNLPMQYDIQDRRRVYAILDSEGIEIPRYAVLDRDSADPKHHELVESEDHVEVNGVTFNKPFVEKPVSAEDHNIYIYYPTSAGGGSQRLFRKIGSRSSVYSPESRVRKTGSYIYEDFMPTDGTDVKVYTVGPDYAHAEARKSPALDGKVERDSEGKEIRYPVILSNAEKLISRKVCLAFKQTVCGFDLLRANGKSFVCDVNGFSFVKNSNKYYDDCAKILGNMILRELAPTLHIPWSVPFQLDDPPIVPTTFGKMMELRCVVAVIRHGDRTPKQKMKVEVRHPKFFEIFAKYDGYKHGHVKLKRPKQLQEILDTARSLLTEIQHRAAGPELEEKQGKLEQLKSVLEMYGHFSGINRKVQMKYQPRGRPRGSSSDDGNSHNRLGEPSLVLILKWGGELTPAGRIQAEELGRIFRCMYPGGQGRHLSEEDSEMLPSHGEYAGAQGLGLLRLHSTFRHDLKIYASDEGRVQMTAAAFAKGLLALEGELTPILVQMVKSANTNGLLDNDCDSSKYQNMVKTRLHELLQQDREFTREDREQINPGNALSINDALDFVKNPVKCCQHVQMLIQKLMDIVRIKKDDPKTKDAILYHGETWELMGRRWGKIEKDFCTKNKRFDISKIPDIYDCIKYDLQHNNHTLQFDHAEELYIYAKYLADIVIPQEYGLTVQEKLTIGQGICTPLLKKIRADLQRNIEESGEETVNRLNPRYSHGVSSPGRHVRTRLYFTSESHVHSLLTVLRYGGLLDVVKDEQWRRAMEYVSMVSELNYMSQIVVMLYEDPTKDPSSEERFHVELHFSPGVNCCVQKNLPPGPGFRPHSRNESSHNLETTSQCSTRIEEEDAELGVLDDDATISPQQQSDSSPPLIETEETADSTLDSPTTSRAIDMMDLDPNMMDEPYDSGFLQGSAPIPISARTVAGHEAARLGSQLAASQRQRREREASSICEPRARSYDHQRQDKPERTADKLQYQSLDAVNKEDDHRSHRFDLDDFFYERVENLAAGGSNSSRNSGFKNSPSCLGTSSSRSLYASSPDLADSFAEALQTKISPLRVDERCNKAATKKSSFPNPPKFKRSKNKVECNDDNDFWDFGETQLLEKSAICQKTEVPDKIITVKPDATNIGLQIDPEIGRIDKTPIFPSTISSETDLVNSETLSQPFEASSSMNNPIPPSNNVFNLKNEIPPRNIQLDVKVGSKDVKEIRSSRNIEKSCEIKAHQDLREKSSTRNLRLLEKSDSQESTVMSSLEARISIERRNSLEITNERSASRERNRVMTRSPSYLGIPIALPHSVSSPELPAPVIETILQSSGTLVTLHNKSLASPIVKSPPRPGTFERNVRTNKKLLSSCLPNRQSCNLMPLTIHSSETKRYGRSKSALTLATVNDARGEFGYQVPDIMSDSVNDRFPIEVSSDPFLCHHCEAATSMGHEFNDGNTSRSGNIEPDETKSIMNSLSQSNNRRMSLTVPEIMSDSVNDRFPIEESSDPFLCHHCEAATSMGHEFNDGKTSRSGNIEPDETNSIRNSLSQVNSHRGSLNVPENCRETDVDLEITSPVSKHRPTNDYHLNDQSNCPQCLCHHCKMSNSIDHECHDSKTSRHSIKIPLSQPISRRSSLILPENCDDAINHSDTVPDKSPPVSTYSHQFLTSSLQNYQTMKSLSNPNSRRASLMIIGTENPKQSMSSCPNCDLKSKHKCSTSLPSRNHSYCRSISAVEILTYGTTEDFRTNSNFRRNSLTVPINKDHEILGRNEDFRKRQNRNFVGRSRSLSPCPQRCLCYNCNVAALIRDSVNLSPAERLNFQNYFVRSLSHKFSNCKCYKESLESAKAWRRLSRSASPNLTSCHEFVLSNNSKLPFGRSLSYFDNWQYPKSRDSVEGSYVNRKSNDNSAHLASFHVHQGTMDHGKEFERRQSSLQNFGSSSKQSSSHCRLHIDSVPTASSGLVTENKENNDICSGNNSTGSRFQELDYLGIVEKSNNVLTVDSFGSIGHSEFVEGNKSDSDDTIDCSVTSDKSNSIGHEKSCESCKDMIVESIDVDPIDFDINQNSNETKFTCLSSFPFAEIVAESSNVVPVENQSPIDDQFIKDNRKSSCSSLSRQLSCPEVVIDTSSTYSSGYPMKINRHCNNCSSGDNDGISNRVNQSQGLESISPASVQSSMEFSKPHGYSVSLDKSNSIVYEKSSKSDRIVESIEVGPIDYDINQNSNETKFTCSSSFPFAEIVAESSNVVPVENQSPIDFNINQNSNETKFTCTSSFPLAEIVAESSNFVPVENQSPIDFDTNQNSNETKLTCPSLLPLAEIVAESSNVVPIENQSPIDDQFIKDNRKSSCSSLSRQLSCPEVVIDTSSTYSSGYPMTMNRHCNNSSSGDNDDISNRVNQSQRLESISPASVLTSMDFLKPEQRNDHSRKRSLLSKQFSCPEVITESSNRLISPNQNYVRTSISSLITQYCSEIDSKSSINLPGSKRKHIDNLKSSFDGQFLYSTDKNDCCKENSLGNRSSTQQRFRKQGFLLPRQFSCPEIIMNTAASSASYSFSHQHNCKSMINSSCDEYCLKSLNPSQCSSHYCNSIVDNCQNDLGTHSKNIIPCFSHFNCHNCYDSENNLTFLHKRIHRKMNKIIPSERYGTISKNEKYKTTTFSLSSNPRLQTQRSFSSPDTRPSIIQEPDPTCTAKRHRHSISGQMSYFKLLGYNVSKKLTGSANSLFSTAVISGSSSAPNLKDMVPSHASVVAAIEGFGGVPPIRPLETLHNALSLRQLDSFLEMMTSAPLFRTPASSPPKFPSPGGSIHGVSVIPNLSIGGINREYHSSDLEAVRYRKKLSKSPIYITPTPINYKSGQDGEGNDLRNQLSPTSPNSTGWSSEPQSFLSSEPSSPAPTSAGECSMSMSLVSNDGTQPFAGPKFSTTPCLDLDFNDFMSIDQDARGESRGSISYTDYYSNEDGLIRKSGPDLAHLRERATRDETPEGSLVDEDEEHTLTLRQTEEQRKQDVKFIFEQNKESSPNLVKPGSSFKKIGRFRVESMDIADEDVRIKEAAAAAAAAAVAAIAAVSSTSSNLSLDQIKATSSSIQDKSVFVGESVAQDSKKLKGVFSTSQPRLGHRGKLFARSQSVSTPQNVSRKNDADYTSQAASNKTGSFSTMSSEDLENWKVTALSPPASVVTSPAEAGQEEPILTLASSLKGASNITVGFNVQQDKKD